MALVVSKMPQIAGGRLVVAIGSGLLRGVVIDSRRHLGDALDSADPHEVLLVALAISECYG